MHFADGGLLLDAEPFHEPAELLRRDALRFGRVSRPLEAPALQPLVEEQEAVPFPQEPLDAVGAPAAEEEERGGERAHLELLLDDGGEAVDGLPHVGAPAGEVDFADGGDVEVLHGDPLHAAASFRRSDGGVSSVSSNRNGPQETMSLSRGSGEATRTATNSDDGGTTEGAASRWTGTGFASGASAGSDSGWVAAVMPASGAGAGFFAALHGCRHSGCSSKSSSRMRRSQ